MIGDAVVSILVAAVGAILDDAVYESPYQLGLHGDETACKTVARDDMARNWCLPLNERNRWGTDRGCANAPSRG